MFCSVALCLKLKIGSVLIAPLIQMGNGIIDLSEQRRQSDDFSVQVARELLLAGFALVLFKM